MEAQAIGHARAFLRTIKVIFWNLAVPQLFGDSEGGYKYINVQDFAKTLVDLFSNVNAYYSGSNSGTPLHHAAKRGLENTEYFFLDVIKISSRCVSCSIRNHSSLLVQLFQAH